MGRKGGAGGIEIVFGFYLKQFFSLVCLLRHFLTTRVLKVVACYNLLLLV
jgi:hypothetical protein